MWNTIGLQLLVEGLFFAIHKRIEKCVERLGVVVVAGMAEFVEDDKLE